MGMGVLNDPLRLLPVNVRRVAAVARQESAFEALSAAQAVRGAVGVERETGAIR